MDSKTENQAVSDMFRELLEQQTQREKDEAYKYRKALPLLVMLVTALSDESLALPNGGETLQWAAEIAHDWLRHKNVGLEDVKDNAERIAECYRASGLGNKATFDRLGETKGTMTNLWEK